jgi:hypothetical protein
MTELGAWPPRLIGRRPAEPRSRLRVVHALLRVKDDGRALGRVRLIRPPEGGEHREQNAKQLAEESSRRAAPS